MFRRIVSRPATTAASLICLGIAWAGGICPSALADDNLRIELDQIAKAIRAELAEGDRPAFVDLIGFADRPSEDARVRPASGAGVNLTLAQELARQGVGVKRGAPFRVSGSVTDVIDSKSKLLAAQVQGAVVDADGKERLEFIRGVFGDAVLSAIWGLTLDLVPTDDYLARSAQMIAAIDKPALHMGKSVVRSTEKSPYGMELLIRDGRTFQPARPVDRKGEAIVSMLRGDVFAVRLHNDTDREAAVLLFVNAVPLFAFSETKQYQQIVLPPRSSSVVRGWFLGGKPLFRAFQPFDYPPSDALPEFPAPSGPGVVTAVFSLAWPRDEPPPDDEPPSTKVRNSSRSAAPNGRELLLKNDGLKAELTLDKPAVPKPLPADEEKPKPADLPAGEEPGRDRADGMFDAASAPVATGFRSQFYDVNREFGVVRTAISIRFELPPK